MGKEGEPDTLLEHVVSDHGKSLSPENFTEFTLKVAGASPPPRPPRVINTVCVEVSKWKDLGALYGRTWGRYATRVKWRL